MAGSERDQIILEETERKMLVNRLKRLEGQIRGVQSMIDTGKSCEDVLTQVMAAKSALNQVGLRVVACTMKGRLTGGAAKHEPEIVDEALEVFLKYVDCLR